MADPLTVLVAARDEEQSIGRTVRTLRAALPDAEVLVADDGSRDDTAAAAEDAGATVLRLARLGKGQALSAAERAAPVGRLLLCDADLDGDVGRLAEHDNGGLVIAAFETRAGGGFGIAKGIARRVVRLRAGLIQREPLSGQRLVSQRARAAVFPLAPGFGCEVRMTIDAARAGLPVEEVVLRLSHRPTRRDLTGFLHRGRQLLDTLLAAGPLAVNFRGRRLPIVGWLVALHEPVVAVLGLADDLWSGPERGFRAHLRAGTTTGTLKLVGIPAYGLVRTRSLSGALAVGLFANVLNQLDTRPGRALKAYLAAALALDAPLGLAVLLLPYDLREMTMLGDAGANALGALLGLKSVSRFTGRGRWLALGTLAGLTILGERTSLGRLIERTPGVRTIDALGRRA
ncbi:MAG TPA: glycosyltransferase [Gaiellaceae bacterium]|nr:glycosyltransferase [Gaiellaceae bacterium]